jgi:hypothetical protein
MITTLEQAQNYITDHFDDLIGNARFGDAVAKSFVRAYSLYFATNLNPVTQELLIETLNEYEMEKEHEA